MPRKVKSTGEPTQQKKTSQKRAMNAVGKSGRNSRGGSVPDGGKWAGSGGPKTRTATRSGGANHPNRG